MEVRGRVISRLPMESGVSQRGEWKKQTFVVQTNEQYPKTIAMEAWGAQFDQVQQLVKGQEVVCSINLESREYNDRWYTTARAWKIQMFGNQQAAPAPAPATPAHMDDSMDTPDDDLPF